MKRALQQLIPAVVSVLPARGVFALTNAFAPRLLRRGFRYAPYLVYAASGKYRTHMLRRFGAGHVCRADVPLGYTMFIPISDNHVVHRSFGVYHPRALLDTMRRLCPPGATVCEIGTHLGEMTLYIVTHRRSSGSL